MMPSLRLSRFLLSLMIACVAVAVRADDEAESASDAEPKSASVSGVFEAINTHEISVGTDQVTSLKVNRLVPHGTVVTKGQNLVWLDTEDVDKQIKKAREALSLSELTFRADEFAYEQFLETQKLDKQAANRSHQKAKQDYDNYVRVDHERQIESAHFSLTNSKASLANAMEELKQLEQMYKEDDLTEESEEIVLKRAQQSVDNAKFRLKGTEISTARSLNQTIPRSKIEQEDTLTRANMAHAKAMREIDTARQRRDIEMGQKRDKFKEEQDNFKELQADRKKLVTTSPVDGIVFHGKLTRGKVSDKPSTLSEGSTVTNKQVLMTVAEPGKLQIRVDLLEKDLPHVKVGVKGTVKIAALPGRTLAAAVKSVSLVPYAGSKFDCVLSVKVPKGEEGIVPGMTCKIDFAIDEKASK